MDNPVDPGFAVARGNGDLRVATLSTPPHRRDLGFKEEHDVKARSLCPLAAALGVWVGGSAVAAPPAKPTVSKTAPATSANQKLAEAIANRLASTAIAEGADITLVTDNGVVTVSGPVRDAEQKKAILQEVRVVPGVKMVRDGITVGPAIRQAQAALPVGPVAPPGPGVGVPPGAAGPIVEPAPAGAPGVAGPANGFAPPLPPYAWPTYAPYNNFSRVAYPQAYPYNAFPFIGPFYPFPKVPLGWRTVTLEWEDGHWWMSKRAAPHDYWRVRFW
jgi:hypothetical protein